LMSFFKQRLNLPTIQIDPVAAFISEVDEEKVTQWQRPIGINRNWEVTMLVQTSILLRNAQSSPSRLSSSGAQNSVCLPGICLHILVGLILPALVEVRFPTKPKCPVRTENAQIDADLNRLGIQEANQKNQEQTNQIRRPKH